MRIAVTGAHQTGKTTLVEELSMVLPSYKTMAEPYHQLEEEGYEFSEMPGVEDFEQQLKLSIKQVCDSSENIIFDRSPIDLLAYLTSHDAAEMFDEEEWLPGIRNAMDQLDLIVFVPIETPDVIDTRGDEFQELRRLVDETLRDILYDYHPNVTEVTGTLPVRLQKVLSVINRQP